MGKSIADGFKVLLRHTGFSAAELPCMLNSAAFGAERCRTHTLRQEELAAAWMFLCERLGQLCGLSSAGGTT